MLKLAEFPLSFGFHFDALLPAMRIRRVFLLALLACAGTMQALHAQSVAASPTPATAPTFAVAGSGVPGTGRDFGTYAPGPAQWTFTQPALSPRNPFLPAPGFGSFNGAASASGPDSAESLNPFGAPRFQAGGSLPRNLTIGPFGAFGAQPSMPALNQLFRGNLGIPFKSSLGDFRLSDRNIFAPIVGSNAVDFSHVLASGVYASSDLGNGMIFSMGTFSGGRSAVGAPAASIGNGSAGGPKHSSPAVALKLSF